MGKPRKLTSREKQALADPVTEAAMTAASEEAKKRFDPQIQAVFLELKAARDPVAQMALKARFNSLAIEQKKFAEAIFAGKLDGDDDGSELVDA